LQLVEWNHEEEIIGWKGEGGKKKEKADQQYHLMENSLLLDHWIQWSEYGTLPPDNN